MRRAGLRRDGEWQKGSSGISPSLILLRVGCWRDSSPAGRLNDVNLSDVRFRTTQRATIRLMLDAPIFGDGSVQIVCPKCGEKTECTTERLKFNQDFVCRT